MLHFGPRSLVSGCFLLLTTAIFAGNEKDYTYLALGDSVAFGLDPRLLVPAPTGPPASDFVGYPEIVAARLHLLLSKKEVNAACPGETSGSFMTPGAPDLGCHDTGPQGQPPYKTWAGLHTMYPGTQLSFATSELSANKHINLVTLGIGSNDVLLLLRDCSTAPDPGACFASQIQGVLQAVGGNLAQILAAIRATNYTGKLVLVGFYSPRPDLDPLAVALRSIMLDVGSHFGVVFADGFGAFQTAAADFGGDACQAGLLIRLDATTCDIHPSPAGRDLLAATVLAAIGDRH